MDDVWKAIAGGAVTLVVGLVLWQIQQGGRRRRRRRDIQEELALLEALGEEHQAVTTRIRRRLVVKLEQYEPATASKRSALERRATILPLLAGLALIGVLSFEFNAPAWITLTTAAITGIGLGYTEAWLGRRRDEREQDEAVATGTGPGETRRVGRAEGRSSGEE